MKLKEKCILNFGEETTELIYSKIGREFISTVAAVHSFYDKNLMKNALFTKIKNTLKNKVNTKEEIKTLLDLFNDVEKIKIIFEEKINSGEIELKKTFKLFTPKHKVYKILEEFN